MKLKMLLPFALILISSLAAVSFYEGIVENYGLGNSKVGEVWTGQSNYKNYVKEATFTVTRKASQSYIDFPIEIVSQFPDAITAPVWGGITAGGVISFTEQMRFKVLKETSDVWNEVPFQISYKTKCYVGLGPNEADCSVTNFRVSLLDLYFLDNITTDTQQYKISYMTSAGNPYRFIYNETSGNYYYTTDSFPARVSFSVSPKKIMVPEINENVTFDSSWNFNGMYAGTYTNTAQNTDTAYIDTDFIGCSSGAFKIFGITPINDVNAPIIIETSKTGCNYLGKGLNTGYYMMDFFPYYKYAHIYSTSDAAESNAYLINLYVDAYVSQSACGSGTGGTTTQASNYLNTSLAMVNFAVGTSDSYNTTSSLYAGTLGIGESGKGGAQTCQAMSISPYTYIIKQGLSSSGIFLNSTGYYSDSTSASTWWSKHKSSVKHNTIGDNENFVVWIGVYPVSYSGPYATYSQTKGLTPSAFHAITQAETYGGKISRYISYGSYSTPCTATVNEGQGCDQLKNELEETNGTYYSYSGELYTTDNQIHLTCGDDNSLGYTDSCGDWHLCTAPCTQCITSTSFLVCSDSCWYIPRAPYCGDDHNSYVFDGCSEAYRMVDCAGLGCDQGVCINANKAAKVTVDVFEESSNVHDTADKPVVDATVHFFGTNMYGDSYNTTCISGSTCIDKLLSPGTWIVYAEKTNYTTGCTSIIENSGKQNVNYGDGTNCSITVNSGAEYSFKIGIRNVNTNPNSTMILVNVLPPINGADPIWNANVTMNYNGASYISQFTTQAGQTVFTQNLTSRQICFNVTSTGYTTLSNFCTSVNIGTRNTVTLFMDIASDISIYAGVAGLGETRRIIPVSNWPFAPDEIALQLKTAKPGKLSLSRVEVRVHPCENDILSILYCDHKNTGIDFDWNVMMTKDQKYVAAFISGAANTTVEKVTLGDLIMGTILGDRYKSQKVKVIQAYGNETKWVPVPFETIRSMNKNGQCEYNNLTYFQYSTDPEDAIKDVIMPTFQCTESDGGEYIIPLDKTNAALFFSVVKKVPSQLEGMVPVPLIEFLSKLRQDIIIDEVIFQPNENLLIDWITSNQIKTITLNGRQISAPAVDLLVNPMVSPLLATGHMPPVLDDGSLDYASKKSALGSTRQSLGIDQGKGIEMQDWSMDLGTYEMNGTKINSIPLSKRRLIGDVETDLVRGNYANKELRYYAESQHPGTDLKLDQGAFEARTFIRLEFLPSDGSTKTIDYIMLPIIIHNYDVRLEIGKWIMILVFSILGFGPLYVALTQKRRKGK
jgi:hypothetical protein